ncbi:copper resistance protein CopC [Demequina sp. SYSU T00192]|uniref:Copper resistance protein CopC n=1 Tax=Demequina litoralis TaxID=3051660 RepID=A0ABT8GBP8_9MICO|nr:copper resistance CopC family protein [Demequina sp. SYSU T00192]MDN4476553.1 copper resistance protein CopC [Demequina sp. SYSU T00192]
MPRIVPRFLAALAAVAGALVLAGAPASAHTALVSSTPAAGETVTALAEVSLEFTEQLLDIGNELAMVAPDGTRTVLAIVEPVTETITAAVPDDALGAGENVLRYRVVAGDGHPIEGEVAFTYAPPVEATPSASASPTPSASASPSASAVVLPTTSPTPHVTVYEEVGPNPAVYVIIGAVAAGALALTIALRGRGNGGGAGGDAAGGPQA